jgi:HAE1 family hydrophobic/amphiphilic exporter-1
VEYVGGTRETMSYNKMMAAWCDIMPKPGVPSSLIMKLIEETPLPKGYIIEWGPVQLQEKENEGRLFWLMVAALIFAYLFLVAQYESWTMPVSVMLSVMFALSGAFLGLWLTGTALSVYAQLGCVMLIGLAAKNAILMVEFAKQERESGCTVVEAAVRGASAGEVAAVEPARDVNITLELDRQQFARAVYRFNNEESRRVGARLAEGGDF